MNLIKFEESDLINWAEFSGDYNLIHFDREFSRRFGNDSVVVHGMLAINLVKAKIDMIVGGLDNFELNFTLKKSIPIDKVVNLEINKSDFQGAEFRMASESGDEDYIIGRLKTESCHPIEFNNDPSKCKKIKINKDYFYDFKSEYDLRFGQSSLWEILDVLCFKEYISGNGSTVLECQIDDLISSRDDLCDHDFAVFHAMHKIKLSHTILKTKDFVLDEDVIVTYCPDEVYEYGDMLFGFINVYVELKDYLVMKQSMGLAVVPRGKN